MEYKIKAEMVADSSKKKCFLETARQKPGLPHSWKILCWKYAHLRNIAATLEIQNKKMR